MDEASIQRLTVRVVVGQKTGSGFFVGRGQVLTCGHVIRDESSNRGVVVEWRGQPYPAKVDRVVHSDPGSTVLPDLALLLISLGNSQAAEIDQDCQPGDLTYAFGYPGDKPAGAPLLGKCEGTDGRGLIQFSQAIVNEGMSGSPLVNQRTGRVCGVVKATRDKDWPVGGYAIPGEVVKRFLARRANPTDFSDGLPTELASQINAFILRFVGLPAKPVPFGGRQESLGELDRWLHGDSEPPYGLLLARPGLGKSALLAHWVSRLRTQAGNPGIIYFPISAGRKTNFEALFFQSVVLRLSALFGEPTPPLGDIAFLRKLVPRYLTSASSERLPLLLVIDGLDEADGWEADTTLFPPLQDRSVRILVAARPTGGDSRNWLARLGWDIPGLAKPFTLAELDQPGVAEALQQMGGGIGSLARKAAFVGTLFEKCKGDPLVLRLYAEQTREKIDRGESPTVAWLQSVEPGLPGFFHQYWWADQIQLWGNRHREREVAVRALLGVCSLAYGPLAEEDVRSLLPTIFHDREALAEAAHDLRRFIEGDGRETGFVFSHPRFKEFALYEILDEDERVRFADSLLAFGSRVVAEFQAGRRQTVPEYILRWHVTQLVERSRLPLAASTAFLDARWCAEWEKIEGTPASFVADLDRVWDCDSTSGIGDLVRLLLTRASVLSRTNIMRWRQFQVFVAGGLLSPALAEIVAGEQETPERIVRFLLIAADHYPKNRPGLCRKALDIAIQMPYGEERLQTLTAIAKLLPSSERTDLLESIVIEARQLTEQPGIVETLCGVAALMSDDRRTNLLEEAIGVAANIPFPHTWCGAVFDIARVLRASDTSLIGQLLAQIGSHPVEETQAEALVAVRELLDKDRQAEAITLAGGFRDPSNRALVNGAMGQTLSTRDRESALTALGAKHGWGRVEGFAVLAALHRDAPQRKQILSSALTAAASMEKPWERVKAVALVSTLASPKERHELVRAALTEADRIPYPEYREDALTEIATYIDPDDEQIAAELLHAARRLTDEPSRGNALIEIARRLNPVARGATVNEAFEILESIPNPAVRVKSIIAAVDRLERADGDLVRRIVSIAERITPESLRADLLASVLRSRRPENREELDDAISKARNFAAFGQQVRCLMALADALGKSEQEEVLELALRTAAALSDDLPKVELLLALANRVTPKRAVQARKMAKAAALRSGNPWFLFVTLLAVADTSAPRQRQAALDNALEAARSIKNWYDQAIALSQVANCLASPDRAVLQREAIKAAMRTRITPETSLEEVIKRLQGPEPSVLRTIRKAIASAQSTFQWELFGELSKRLEAPERERALRDALASALATDEGPSRAEAICGVAQYLTPFDLDMVEEIVREGLKMGASERSRVLGGIVSKMTESHAARMRDHLLAAFAESPSTEMVEGLARRWKEFCGFLNRSTADELRAWLGALKTRRRDLVLNCLAAFVPAIETAGGQPALEQFANAVVTTGAGWP